MVMTMITTTTTITAEISNAVAGNIFAVMTAAAGSAALTDNLVVPIIRAHIVHLPGESAAMEQPALRTRRVATGSVAPQTRYVAMGSAALRAISAVRMAPAAPPTKPAATANVVRRARSAATASAAPRVRLVVMGSAALRVRLAATEPFAVRVRPAVTENAVPGCAATTNAASRSRSAARANARTLVCRTDKG